MCIHIDTYIDKHINTKDGEKYQRQSMKDTEKTNCGSSSSYIL